MSLIKKPMLAAKMEFSDGTPATFSDLLFPKMGSIKLDGIRCITRNGVSLSRSFESIPNLFVQKTMADLPSDLDGELVTINKDGSLRTFNQIQSDIMSEDGEPNFKYMIFDYVKDSLNKDFSLRFLDLKNLVLPHYCEIVDHVVLNSVEELEKYEEKIVNEGHEGVMLRTIKGPYKCGRATFKSQDLLKIKRFVDSEAVIIGFKEKFKNDNEAEVDQLGHTKRSNAKAGLIPANTLGTLLVKDMYSNVEFGIGTGIGFNDELKKTIWQNQDKYLGKIIKYRYQGVGSKLDKTNNGVVPRIPSFQGFRSKLDM